MGWIDMILGGEDWKSLGRDILTGRGNHPWGENSLHGWQIPTGMGDPWEGRALGCKAPIRMATDHWDGERLGWEGCFVMKDETIARPGERG